MINIFYSILNMLSYNIIMMKKVRTNFVFIHLRKNLITIIFVLFAIGLITFSKDNLSASKEGLTLWMTSVVPSLLPFFIACELLSNTNIIDYLGEKLGKIMRPIFNVPGEGAFPFIMGIISGYPVGAKIVTNFRKNGICTKEEAERLITFTNNSGPLFVIGTVRNFSFWKYDYWACSVFNSCFSWDFCSGLFLGSGSLRKKILHVTILETLIKKNLPHLLII